MLIASTTAQPMQATPFIALPDEIVNKIQEHVRYNFEKENAGYLFIKVPSYMDTEQGIDHDRLGKLPSWMGFYTDDSDVRFKVWYPCSYYQFLHYNSGNHTFKFNNKIIQIDLHEPRLDRLKPRWDKMIISGFDKLKVEYRRESQGYMLPDVVYEDDCYTAKNLKDLTIKVPFEITHNLVLSPAARIEYSKIALSVELLKMKWQHKQLT